MNVCRSELDKLQSPPCCKDTQDCVAFTLLSKSLSELVQKASMNKQSAKDLLNEFFQSTEAHGILRLQVAKGKCSNAKCFLENYADDNFQ